MSARTSAYIRTFSTYDEEKIANIRHVVSLINATHKKNGSSKRWRIKIRPRLGLNSIYRDLYARGGALHRYTSQDIKREHGARFDIYMHRR